MKISLPMPPSSNHYKKPRRFGGMYLTDEARNYRAVVANRCAMNGLKPIAKGSVQVEYIFFRGEKNGKLQRGDLANYEKVLSDCLQGFAFRNDSQIRRIVMELHEDRKNPGVVVEVLEVPKDFESRIR